MKAREFKVCTVEAISQKKGRASVELRTRETDRGIVFLPNQSAPDVIQSTVQGPKNISVILTID